jgi:leucyl-tRNA synthetase
MSKSKHNVQNPDELVEKYGADTLRMYEMFLGPLEQSKPWDTNGIEGVFRFFKKLWKLFYDDKGAFIVVDEDAAFEEQKALHSTIKKIGEDIERISFNTSVSNFMICVNELTDLKCHKKCILEKLLVLLSPFAPHIAEELWQQSGNKPSIADEAFPSYDDKYLVESSIKWPVSFNGKTRFMLELPADMSKNDIEKAALEAPQAQKWIEGKQIRKVIIVPKKIINIVL